MNTITIVYKVHWSVEDHWYNEIDSDRCVDSNRVIDKIFYKSYDAEKYMNSIPNQSYPPDYIELMDNPDDYEFATGFYLDNPDDYEFATGFYLVDEQYPIE